MMDSRTTLPVRTSKVQVLLGGSSASHLRYSPVMSTRKREPSRASTTSKKHAQDGARCKHVCARVFLARMAAEHVPFALLMGSRTAGHLRALRASMPLAGFLGPRVSRSLFMGTPAARHVRVSRVAVLLAGFWGQQAPRSLSKEPPNEGASPRPGQHDRCATRVSHSIRQPLSVRFSLR